MPVLVYFRMHRSKRPDPRDTNPIEWVGSSKEDLSEFPRDVKARFGFALHVAQLGRKHPDAKPLQGFGGAGVLEVVARFEGDAFRAVYTVKLAGRVYVLHAFQKKSKSGISTRKADIDLIRARLKIANSVHAEWTASKERKPR